MNENLPPKTPAISAWLHHATHSLVGAGISSAKLDAELILSHTIGRPRTYLHAHSDELIGERHLEIANARLQLRIERTPLAYIIGHKEFYGHLFKVTPATLIPRPESEVMIDILLNDERRAQLPLHATRRLVDVGTGSGCLGISAKLALPDMSVTLLDVSRHALQVARDNAANLGADVTVQQSNLLSNYPFTAHYILANLPYVDRSWERSRETNYEPALALFADHGGLALIRRLIAQTPDHLARGGHLLIEADPRQHDDIVAYAKPYGLSETIRHGFIIDLIRD